MKTNGRNSSIIAAYTTLFTVALGIVVLDPLHQGPQSKAGTPPSMASAVAPKPATSPETRASAPVAVAGYTALRQAK